MTLRSFSFTGPVAQCTNGDCVCGVGETNMSELTAYALKFFYNVLLATKLRCSPCVKLEKFAPIPRWCDSCFPLSHIPESQIYSLQTATIHPLWFWSPPPIDQNPESTSSRSTNTNCLKVQTDVTIFLHWRWESTWHICHHVTNQICSVIAPRWTALCALLLNSGWVDYPRLQSQQKWEPTGSRVTGGFTGTSRLIRKK